MVALFGRRTEMPLWVGWMLDIGMEVWTRSLGECWKKWAVAPVSATIGEVVWRLGCCTCVNMFAWFMECLSNGVSVVGMRVIILGVGVL